MKKVIAYVDAYNLYHSLKDKDWKQYYWLDLSALFKRFLKEDQVLKKIYYFTSPATDSGSRKRQITYIEALERTAFLNMVEFETIRGKFRPSPVKCGDCKDFAICPQCGKTVDFEVEKHTDVNLAVQMISDAYEDDVFDIAFLVTGDSDQVGTVKAIRRLMYDTKQVGLIIPPERPADELQQVANFYLHIDRSMLAQCQLPDPVIKPDGYQLCRPVQWRNKQ